MNETSERGSLTAFLAVLALGLFVLVGLVVDGGRALVARRQAVDVAEQAARVGADQLSVDALRSGQFVVDPASAASAVTNYLEATGATGTVSVTGNSVTVHIVHNTPTTVLGMIGIGDIPVSATAAATNLHGVTRGD